MAKNEAQNQLINERNTLDDLDELGEIMTQMLDRQQDVEVRSNIHFTHIAINGYRHTSTTTWVACKSI